MRCGAVRCGVVRCGAGSPIHHFVSNGELDLSQHDRRRMSGQVESGSGQSWRSMQQAFLAARRQRDQEQERELGGAAATPEVLLSGAGSWPGRPPSLLVDTAAAAIVSGGSSLPHPLPPYAPPLESASSGRKMRAWTPEDVRLAAGSRAGSGGGGDGSDGPVARHPLELQSAYRAVTGGEATYSTAHDKFIGCVDYMFFTPTGDSGSSSSGGGGSRGGGGGGEAAGTWRLVPQQVLEPPPLQTLHCALPSPAWPSDHIALVADFALHPPPPPPVTRRRS